jgi:hypothetical protein
MTTENPPMKGKWIDLIDESVHTVDDVDIGDIYSSKKRVCKYTPLLYSNPSSRWMGWTYVVAKNYRG